MAEREFRAKYSAPCKICGRDVKGMVSTWIRSRDTMKKGYVHKECWDKQQPDAASPYEPIPADLGLSEPVNVAPQANGHTAPKSSDGVLLDLLSESLWTRIESRVKAVESTSDELVASVESQLEAFKSELVELAIANRGVLTTVKVVRDNAEPITVENAHKQLPLLIDLISRCRASSVAKWPYLWDATGGGKSHAVPQAATTLGLRYTSQSYNSQSPDYLITGYCDANGHYVPSVFYDYYKNGGVYCGEELDDASADLLVTLNVALANGHMTFPNGEHVTRHADFVFVGCGNTPGRGPTPRYPERKPFDAAFANRFFFVRWQYDTALEQQVALSINPGALPYVQWVYNARESAERLGLRLELTPRTTFVLAELSMSSHITDDLLLDGVLAGIDETAKSKLLANVPFPTRD